MVRNNAYHIRISIRKNVECHDPWKVSNQNQVQFKETFFRIRIEAAPIAFSGSIMWIVEMQNSTTILKLYLKSVFFWKQPQRHIQWTSFR